MHQRRQGQVTITTVPSGGEVDFSRNSTAPIKRRRKRTNRRKKGDTIVTTTQAILVITLMVFAIMLVLRSVGTSSEAAKEDDSQTNSPPKKRRSPMSNGLYPRIDMPPSKVYQIPGSLSFVGDKSDQYAELRKEFDAKMANGELGEVKPRYEFDGMPMNDNLAKDYRILPEPYDIYNCPEQPPTHYPYDWNLLTILHHWEPDDPMVPEDPTLYQGLCIFDYERDYDKAITYRQKEVPFVVVNDPQVQAAVKRWNAPTYMGRMLGNVMHKAELSDSNHFLYSSKVLGQVYQQLQRHNGESNEKIWKEPTTMLQMTYLDWLEHANLTATGKIVGPDDPHYYFRLIGCGETGPEGACEKESNSSEYLFDELPFFQPKVSLYVVDPMEQKGIHCRFGMHGVIAENHYDQSRNAIAVLGGERRYILAHPNQCKFMSLYPKGHPSARHSAVDWSNPDLDAYPEFAEARANEVVLQPGNVLYLPTGWFHYIVSLNLNFQCNTRSGVTKDYHEALQQCGF